MQQPNLGLRPLKGGMFGSQMPGLHILDLVGSICIPDYFVRHFSNHYVENARDIDRKGNVHR